MFHQTSQRNWVIIKVLYRCLQRYLLSWRISRLGFVTPIVGEVSYGFICFDVPKEFGVPDEIGDLTRSLEMVET